MFIITPYKQIYFLTAFYYTLFAFYYTRFLFLHLNKVEIKHSIMSDLANIINISSDSEVIF